MQRKALKLLITLAIIAVPAWYFLFVYPLDMPLFPRTVLTDGPVVHVGNVPIRVEVADTDASRAKGLGGRDTLDATSGMLFIFDRSDYHQIWMKDMRISIDVIWVDDRFKVVDIIRGLRPDTYPQTFEPLVPARFAIETNVHYAESFGIKVGDTVTLPVELIPADVRQ